MKVSLMLKLFITFIITGYSFVSYAGKPELYTAESGETWTTGGSGDHGGLTPSGNVHQGVTTPPGGGPPDTAGGPGGGTTTSSGPTASPGGGSNFSPEPEIIDNGGAPPTDPGVSSNPAEGSDPNLPVNNNADGGGPGTDQGQGGGAGADPDNHVGVDNPSGKDNQGLGPGNNNNGGGGGGDNTTSQNTDDPAPGDGTGEDSYTSSNEDQNNGEQEKKNDQHETEIKRKTIGFNFVPYPIVMADVDMYTHIINLNSSDNPDFQFNPETNKVEATQTPQGFKVVQMRRGSLTLGVGTSGGITGLVADSAAGALPRINFNLTVSAGGTYIAERFYKTYAEAKKMRYEFYTRVPTDKKQVLERMNIGDALTYKVSGSIAIGAGVSAAYGTVGVGAGASVTGSWTKQIRRIQGRKPGQVRVQVAFVSGEVASANINGKLLAGQKAKEWYDTLDETIAYEFNLDTEKGEDLFQEMLKGNILVVKYEYMKKLAAAEDLNRMLKGWYWNSKKTLEQREVEFYHEKMIEKPKVKYVKNTLLADEILQDNGKLKPFLELTLDQVERLPQITSVSATTLAALILHKKKDLKLSPAARVAYSKQHYMAAHFKYNRLFINKKSHQFKKVYTKELVKERIAVYEKKKIIIGKKIDEKALNRLRALSLGLKWKKKAMDNKKKKDAFNIYLDRERVLVINTMKDTFDAFMISVGKRHAYGVSNKTSAGIPVLFSFNYNSGNEEVAVESAKVIEEGLVLKNYIGAFKAENRTTGLLSHHHTRSTAFYGGISDITLLKPATKEELAKNQGPRKSIKIFAALKYAYDRDGAGKDEWLDELKNLSERIGYRRYVVTRPRPYESQATYLQLTADWILSQEAILSLMAYQRQDKDLSGLAKTAIDFVKIWFEKNPYDEGNLDELSDKEIENHIKSKSFAKLFGGKTQIEAINVFKANGANGVKKYLSKSFYNDHKEICILSDVGTKPTRNMCENAYIEEVGKDLKQMSLGLEIMNKNNPFDEKNKGLSYQDFRKLAKDFSKGMAKFGRGIVNNQFIVNTLQYFLENTQKKFKSVDQYMVMQWQGSAEPSKAFRPTPGLMIPSMANKWKKQAKGLKSKIKFGRPSFPRGSFILIPSNHVIYRGNQICGRRGVIADGDARCLPSAMDPI